MGQEERIVMDQVTIDVIETFVNLMTVSIKELTERQVDLVRRLDRLEARLDGRSQAISTLNRNMHTNAFAIREMRHYHSMLVKSLEKAGVLFREGIAVKRRVTTESPRPSLFSRLRRTLWEENRYRT
jgi:tetrahydromethanopterin S-methyltransferase subunit B